MKDTTVTNAMQPLRKRYLPLFVLLLLLPALAACAAKAAGEPLPATAAGGASETAGTLTAILTDVSENFHPATAGSSLTATRLAGQLLDWHAEAQTDADGIRDAAERFQAALDADASRLFFEQLTAVYDAACGLTAEQAADQIEAAGYEPASFPWTGADVAAVFPALFAGIGQALPD